MNIIDLLDGIPIYHNIVDTVDGGYLAPQQEEMVT